MNLPFETAPRGRSSRFLEDVFDGLGRARKCLPCKYFYDDEGSRLFDEITTLDEYYPTRAELGIMAEHAREMAEALGPEVLLVEPGAGSVRKVRSLLAALADPVGYVAVDIAGDHVRASTDALRSAHPGLWVAAVEADFTRPFTLPEPPSPPRRRLVYFPGSTIGNFAPLAAAELLTTLHDLVEPEGALLLGVDLVKDEATLVRAYDDLRGVTATFNKNLLARINRELQGTFDLDRFEHVARWNPGASRIEMSLRSRVDQRACVAGRTFAFQAGEEIVTEHCQKYTKASLAEVAAPSGFVPIRMFTDPHEHFAVALLGCTPRSSRKRRRP